MKREGSLRGSGARGARFVLRALSRAKNRAWASDGLGAKFAGVLVRRAGDRRELDLLRSGVRLLARYCARGDEPRRRGWLWFRYVEVGTATLARFCAREKARATGSLRIRNDEMGTASPRAILRARR